MQYFKIFFFLLLILGSISCVSSNKILITPDSRISEEAIHYDVEKATAYGADQYGMKKYVIAFLKRGPNRSQDSIQRQKIFIAHMKNIDRMAEAGKLAIAGPFLDDGELRGIYIFNVKTIDEAEELTNSDPAIQSGTLIMELKEWYGSAALMGVNEVHKTLSKSSIVE